MDFCEFLRLKRKERGIKIKTLACLLGISTSYLSSIESGTRNAPDYETLKKIADVLMLKTEDRYMLYDLAAESRKTPTLADDLTAYIFQIPKIRNILRYSMERNLTEKEWELIGNFVARNFFF